MKPIDIGPDLFVASLTGPSSAAPGQTVTVTDVTENLGAEAAGPSVTRFYLASRKKFGGSEVLLSSRAVPALAAGESNQAGTQITIPADTEPDSYFIIAFADALGAVAESSERNNFRVLAIVIGP